MYLNDSITSAPGGSENEIQIPGPSAEKDPDSEISEEKSENEDGEKIIFNPPSKSTKKSVFPSVNESGNDKKRKAPPSPPPPPPMRRTSQRQCVKRSNPSL